MDPDPNDRTETGRLGPDESTLDGGAASLRAGGNGAIGPYRLLEKLGEGGMGEVWLAEQQEPVRRSVALKILKPGLDSRHVIARFEAERQALAMMDHPAIAKVYDAGATPRGLPYFAMELVRGVPITEHCDRHRLDTRERLELFVRVCEGVQHAHQKAVIHRDIKPSNVLVSYEGERHRPKVIDFGVAKATARPLTDKTLHTRIGVLIGTPEYMSPEQAEMSGQDIDTRTDVYALGVMLYELLVGALPFDSSLLRSKGLDELRRQIREEEPSRPSVRLASLGEQTGESARRRRSDPLSLERELSGDLDWITMKALEKDRSRRYGSPAELAADLQRYLSDEAVLARPPSTAYRAGKFVRRHRVGVGAAAAAVLVLVAFAVMMTAQARRLAAERDASRRARSDLERVVEFQTRMLGDVDPARLGRRLADEVRAQLDAEARTAGWAGPDIATFLGSYDALSAAAGPTNAALAVLDGDILRRAIDAIDLEFADAPRIAASLRLTIGATYRRLGLYEQAHAQITRALDTRRGLLDEDHPEVLEATRALGRVLHDRGHPDEARRLLDTVLDARRRTLGDDDPRTIESVFDLGSHFHGYHRYDEARPLLESAFEMRRRILGVEHPDTLASMHLLGTLYWNEGRFEDAEAMHKEALDRRRRVLGETHPHTLASMHNLALVYKSTDRLDDAEQLQLETLELARRAFGDEHPRVLAAKNNLANSYRLRGRLDEAEVLHRETLEARERLYGRDNTRTLGSIYNLAGVAAQRRDRELALSRLERFLDLRRHAVSAAVEYLRADEDFAWLHGDPEFETLIARAEARDRDRREGSR